MLSDKPNETTVLLGQKQTKRPLMIADRAWGARMRKLSNYLFVLPMIIFMLATMAYPIYVNVDMSLHDLNIRTFRAGDAPYIGLDNYRKLIDDPTFWSAARRSLTFTSVSLAFQFFIGFGLALFFNRPFPGNGFLRAMLLLAWLLPAVVGGTLFRWIADGDYGVFNYFLESIGLGQVTNYWLIDPDTALIGTIVANVWVGAPFHLMLLLAGLQNISPTLYEAASIDGADTTDRFWRITLPLMRPVILGVLLLGFIYTFKVFELIFVMTEGGPVDATTVLPIHIYKLTFSFFRFGEGAAAAMLLLLGLLFLAVGYAQLIRAEETA
jgi:multiple sugar transport system permease protein